eukprot:355568-Chlamydomonas_euryale.AAC.4
MSSTAPQTPPVRGPPSAAAPGAPPAAVADTARRAFRRARVRTRSGASSPYALSASTPARASWPSSSSDSNDGSSGAARRLSWPLSEPLSRPPAVAKSGSGCGLGAPPSALCSVPLCSAISRRRSIADIGRL